MPSTTIGPDLRQTLVGWLGGPPPAERVAKGWRGAAEPYPDPRVELEEGEGGEPTRTETALSASDRFSTTGSVGKT